MKATELRWCLRDGGSNWTELQSGFQIDPSACCSGEPLPSYTHALQCPTADAASTFSTAVTACGSLVSGGSGPSFSPLHRLPGKYTCVISERGAELLGIYRLQN